MPTMNLLRIEGAVGQPLSLGYNDFARMDARDQVVDLKRHGYKRGGDAVRLAALLRLARVHPDARFLGLHGTADDFHASIPLEPVLDQALVIFRIDGAPLPAAIGGPFRLFIPDHAACHMAEIDECANVKFLDRIELTVEKGQDNRPQDEVEHAKLHESQE